MWKGIAPSGVAAGIVFLACPLLSQGGPTTVQFSFTNPGARSLGLGGAFVAIADDATAAFANPAGLTQLTRPEISLEGRYWNYSTPFTVSGRVSGRPTGIGLDDPLRTAEAEFDASAVSFLSFVYPKGNWTLALSRHQLAKYGIESRTQGLFTDRVVDDPQPTCIVGSDVCRYPDVRRFVDLDIETTTLSFAYRVLENLSLGLGLSYFGSQILFTNDFFLTSEETLPEGFFGPNSYAPAARIGGDVISFDDSDWQADLGLLWFPSRQWSLGAVYRPGPEFSGSGAVISGPALDPPIPEGSIGTADPAIPVKIPDVYGWGVAYRSANGRWTGSFEWDLVLYSQLLEKVGESPLVDVVEVLLDDAHELRLGIEYAFLQWKPLVALRGGVWRNPDHTIRTIEDDPLERALLPEGKDNLHGAFGFGIVFKNLQIDLAIDFSDLVDTAALSLIYQF